MLSYDDMVSWSRDYELVYNRVKIVNQLHGCRYADSSANPCRVTYDHGSYLVRYLDTILCTFGVYDVSGIALALSVLDRFSDCVWSMRRAGFLAV